MTAGEVMTTGEVVGRRGVPSIVPILNPLVRRLLRVGVPMGPNVLLTIRGRTSGQPRAFPVALMESGGRQYVFATFGEVNWVRNLRAAGEAVLRRGRRNEVVVAVELPAEEAALVMADALAPFLASPITAPLLRRWYDLERDSSPAEYLEEARHHAVFELREAPEHVGRRASDRPGRAVGIRGIDPAQRTTEALGGQRLAYALSSSTMRPRRVERVVELVPAGSAVFTRLTGSARRVQQEEDVRLDKVSLGGARGIAPP